MVTLPSHAGKRAGKRHGRPGRLLQRSDSCRDQSCANVTRSRGFGRASQIAQRPHPPDATFATLLYVTAPTAAETKIDPRNPGVSRYVVSTPHSHSVHAYEFDREPTAHGSSIPSFRPIRRQ